MRQVTICLNGVRTPSQGRYILNSFVGFGMGRVGSYRIGSDIGWGLGLAPVLAVKLMNAHERVFDD